MRLSIKSLAPAAMLAAAIVLPAVGTVTVASATAQANNGQIKRIQLERINPRLTPRINRHHINPNLTLRRCYASRRYLHGKSVRILRHRGHRRIRLVSYYRTHCHQYFRYRACRGARLYHVVVRYKYGRYAGMKRRVIGHCRYYRGGHLRHRS